MVKFSYVAVNTYEGQEAYTQGIEPPANSAFDPEVGRRSWDHTLDLAILAENVGFDWVTVTEHHATPFVSTPSPTIFAAVLCQVLKRVKVCIFGPLVPLSSPVRIAEEIAQVDQLSDGRVMFMPLRGTPPEIKMAGLDPNVTRAMTQEGTELIIKALTAHEPFDWKGTHYQFENVSIWPAITQRPRPRMYYSGNSTESAAFAASHELGIGFSFYPPHLVAEVVKFYYEEAAKAGWQPEPEHIVNRSFCVVTETQEEAESIRAGFFGAAAPRTEMPKAIGTDADGRAHPGADQGGAGFGLGSLPFCGTPEHVAERMFEFQQQTGVGVFDFSFSAGHTPFSAVRRSIELMGSEVIPHFRKREDELVAPQAAAV